MIKYSETMVRLRWLPKGKRSFTPPFSNRQGRPDRHSPPILFLISEQIIRHWSVLEKRKTILFIWFLWRMAPCLGWCSNFVGSESGQKHSVKIQQKMVYNTVRLLWEGGRIGGGQREGRVATVHKSGRKYQHDWLHLQSVNLLNISKDDI